MVINPPSDSFCQAVQQLCEVSNQVKKIGFAGKFFIRTVTKENGEHLVIEEPGFFQWFSRLFHRKDYVIEAGSKTFKLLSTMNKALKDHTSDEVLKEVKKIDPELDAIDVLHSFDVINETVKRVLQKKDISSKAITLPNAIKDESSKLYKKAIDIIDKLEKDIRSFKMENGIDCLLYHNKDIQQVDETIKTLTSKFVTSHPQGYNWLVSNYKDEILSKLGKVKNQIDNVLVKEIPQDIRRAPTINFSKSVYLASVLEQRTAKEKLGLLSYELYPQIAELQFEEEELSQKVNLLKKITENLFSPEEKKKSENLLKKFQEQLHGLRDEIKQCQNLFITNLNECLAYVSEQVSQTIDQAKPILEEVKIETASREELKNQHPKIEKLNEYINLCKDNQVIIAMVNRLLREKPSNMQIPPNITKELDRSSELIETFFAKAYDACRKINELEADLASSDRHLTFEQWFNRQIEDLSKTMPEDVQAARMTCQVTINHVSEALEGHHAWHNTFCKNAKAEWMKKEATDSFKKVQSLEPVFQEQRQKLQKVADQKELSLCQDISNKIKTHKPIYESLEGECKALLDSQDRDRLYPKIMQLLATKEAIDQLHASQVKSLSNIKDPEIKKQAGLFLVPFSFPESGALHEAVQNITLVDRIKKYLEISIQNLQITYERYEAGRDVTLDFYLVDGTHFSHKDLASKLRKVHEAIKEEIEKGLTGKETSANSIIAALKELDNFLPRGSFNNRPATADCFDPANLQSLREAINRIGSNCQLDQVFRELSTAINLIPPTVLNIGRQLKSFGYSQSLGQSKGRPARG